MKISYGLTAWIEHEELNNLLNYLKENINSKDEIVVVYDQNRATPEVLSVLENFDRHNYSYHPFNFQQDWLANKNYLGTKCSGDYIFQIDADEIPHKNLIDNLRLLIESNPVDVFVVPRINLVKGLTQEHVNAWKWNINEQGWVNFPDPQRRIYKNDPSIQWKDPVDQPQVHGMVEGYKTFANLPFSEEWSLYHNKTISKQEYQNNLYSKVLSGKDRDD